MVFEGHIAEVTENTVNINPIPQKKSTARNKQDQKDLINLSLCRAKLSVKVKV